MTSKNKWKQSEYIYCDTNTNYRNENNINVMNISYKLIDVTVEGLT